MNWRKNLNGIKAFGGFIIIYSPIHTRAGNYFKQIFHIQSKLLIGQGVN